MKCEICGKEIERTGPNQKYCPTCAETIYPLKAARYRRENAAWCNQVRKEWRKDNPESVRASSHKRRGLGFIPLNESFDGSQAHHIDLEHVIYVPQKLHMGIKHDVRTGKNMDIINSLAMAYLRP